MPSCRASFPTCRFPRSTAYCWTLAIRPTSWQTSLADSASTPTVRSICGSTFVRENRRPTSLRASLNRNSPTSFIATARIQTAATSPGTSSSRGPGNRSGQVSIWLKPSPEPHIARRFAEKNTRRRAFFRPCGSSSIENSNNLKPPFTERCTAVLRRAAFSPSSASILWKID